MTTPSAVTIVSLFAASLSMVSYVPQAWGIVRSGKTDGLSVKMYALTVIGFVTWLVYGILVRQWPIIIQNIICLCLSLFILVMILLPHDKTVQVAEALRPPGIDE